MGKKIGYLGASSVFHQGGATLDRSSARKLYLNIRNSLSMIKKNVAFPTFILVFVCKFLLEGLASINYLLSKNFLFAQSIGKGYRDFIKTSSNYPSPVKKSLHGPTGSGPVRFLFFQVMILRKRKFTDF